MRFHAWRLPRSKTAYASIRMNFATAYARELRVASPDALLQFGHGALGSDFGGLVALYEGQALTSLYLPVFARLLPLPFGNAPIDTKKSGGFWHIYLFII